MKKAIIIFGTWLVVCLSSVQGWSQMIGGQFPADIKGEVRDAVTLRPVDSARVILELARYGYVDETNTGPQGKFEFRGLNHAVYVVRVQVLGYRGTAQVTNTCDPAGCKRIDLSANTTEYVTFNLQPLAREPEASLNVKMEIPEAARREFDKGKELADAGKAGASIGHFKRAVELYPTFEQAYFRMGIAYMDQNNPQGAESALLKVTQLNPNNGAAFLALGTLYANQKDFAGAEKPLVRGLALSPDVAEGHCELSLTYWALKRLAESDQHAKKCAALKPDYAQAHLLLGNLALARSDQQGAFREYKEYLRLDPQGLYAAAARQQIDRLEKALGPQPQAK